MDEEYGLEWEINQALEEKRRKAKNPNWTGDRPVILDAEAPPPKKIILPDEETFDREHVNIPTSNATTSALPTSSVPWTSISPQYLAFNELKQKSKIIKPKGYRGT